MFHLGRVLSRMPPCVASEFSLGIHPEISRRSSIENSSRRSFWIFPGAFSKNCPRVHRFQKKFLLRYIHKFLPGFLKDLIFRFLQEFLPLFLQVIHLGFLEEFLSGFLKMEFLLRFWHSSGNFVWDSSRNCY